LVDFEDFVLFSVISWTLPVKIFIYRHRSERSSWFGYGYHYWINSRLCQ